ncbi:nitronate monooxygenase [Nocardioides convexus]|uniref:nitronate monooxygenase n=1 Tax=Nocardioides convexus TaxID=2712224 RepID=UPI002418165D|nr:nitronate monooxygenase [Nocardioides convexus]
MGWVSGPRLVSGTANAGGLGILASATMTFAEPGAGDRRGQGTHRPAVRREPARRRRRRGRPLPAAHRPRREGGLLRARAQARA